MTFITLVDKTLREGNQAPGIKLTTQATLTIACALADAGVDFIEAGHPCASTQEFDRVAALVKSKIAKNILAHSRAHRGDIDAVAATGANWIGIFSGINEASQKYRLRKSKVQIHALIKQSVLYAKSLNLKVRFTIEDASRTSLEAGATFISCTVNGIGERCGITETCLLITNLHFNSIPCSGKTHKVLNLSSIVSKALGDTFDRRRPIIGEYSFVHTAKLHVTANSRNRNCYHWADPTCLSE